MPEMFVSLNFHVITLSMKIFACISFRDSQISRFSENLYTRKISGTVISWKLICILTGNCKNNYFMGRKFRGEKLSCKEKIAKF